MKNFLMGLLREESGQDLVEYALIVALVALFCVAALKGVATAIANALQKIVDGLNAAVS